MHALTIHKSQGSQAEGSTVLLPAEGSRLLTRELFYTAMTRAREPVRVVGSGPTCAPRSSAGPSRATGLRQRLRGPVRPLDGRNLTVTAAARVEACPSCCVCRCPTSRGRWVGWRPRSVRRAATSRRSRSSRSATTAPRSTTCFLEMDDGAMPDSIVSACTELDGVKVLWISRYAAGGNVFLDLEAVEELTADPDEALDRLVDLLPVVFRADWGARRAPVARRRPRTEAAPDSLGWVDLPAERMLERDGDLSPAARSAPTRSS